MSDAGRRLQLDVFEYSDYRVFLSAAYRQMKSDRPGFSFRYFSREAGFSSPNFLKLVIEGKRNLSAGSIPCFARALKLTRPEATYFQRLVLLNQARTLEERQEHSRRLLKSRMIKRLQPLKQAQLRYYARWYYVAVRELVATAGFREDPAWIAGRLNPAITADEAAEALVELEKLGLLKRDAQGGRLAQAEANVGSGDEVLSPWVAQFHIEMMRKGSEAIERFRREEREISSVTVAVTPEGAARIKRRIQEFRKEILALADEEKAPSRLMQFNLQLFPLDRVEGEKV